MKTKHVIFFISFLLISFAIAAGLYWAHLKVRLIETETVLLGSALEDKQNEMARAIHLRASKQKQWIETGPLKSLPEEAKRKADILITRLLTIPFRTSTDFAEGDRLQSALSEIVAQYLSKNIDALDKAALRAFEQTDRTVDEARKAYGELALQYNSLLTHPLLRWLGKKQILPAAQFQADVIKAAAPDAANPGYPIDSRHH